ncbi:hypothetical protein P8452_51924 [Trifolium repens]|nr:hypothetical protein P8452_51924 [Trifolium repens]
MIGSQATEQGDCSKFNSFNPLPHSCKKDPTIVDLLSGAHYNQQPHCCRGGILISLAQDPTNEIVRPTKYLSSDKRRTTQAFMT